MEAIRQAGSNPGLWDLSFLFGAWGKFVYVIPIQLRTLLEVVHYERHHHPTDFLTRNIARLC